MHLIEVMLLGHQGPLSEGGPTNDTHVFRALALSSLRRASVDGESFLLALYSTAHSAWLVGHSLSCCRVSGSDRTGEL